MTTKEQSAEEVCLWIADVAQRACQANDMPEAFDCIEWEFSTTLGSCAGRATYDQLTQRGIIELSLTLWHQATPEERKSVIIHEVCHILTLIKDRYSRAHGASWNGCVSAAGSVAQVYHSIGRKKRNWYELTCCPEGRIGPIQYLKVLTGKQVYQCRFCRSVIVSVKQVILPAS